MPAPLLLLLTVLFGAPLTARADDLIMLLEARSCPNCKLADADLVHADLRDADLKGAHLQRANLSNAPDGADPSSISNSPASRAHHYEGPTCETATSSGPICAVRISPVRSWINTRWTRATGKEQGVSLKELVATLDCTMQGLKLPRPDNGPWLSDSSTPQSQSILMNR